MSGVQRAHRGNKTDRLSLGPPTFDSGAQLPRVVTMRQLRALIVSENACFMLALSIITVPATAVALAHRRDRRDGLRQLGIERVAFAIVAGQMQ